MSTNTNGTNKQTQPLPRNHGDRSARLIPSEVAKLSRELRKQAETDSKKGTLAGFSVRIF